MAKESEAKKIIRLLDPGEKKATDQVSKLQKFDFDYVDGRKKYKKFDESNFTKKLFKFLDHPWQEDKEIEFVELLSEYKDKFEKSNSRTIKSYLKKMDTQLTGATLQLVSDKFINDWNDLIK
jgi:hypothetical protein